MIKKIHFSFSELEIDFLKINQVLGFPENELPEPFNEYLAQAINDCETLEEFCGVYIIQKTTIEKLNFTINQTIFKPGKTICKELDGSSDVALFICTAGQTVSQQSEKLLKSDPVLGYIYDVLGSAIVEAVGDKISSIINQEVAQQNLKTTNRFSPGYCHWNVSEQQLLFQQFNNETCGVQLSESSLMSPIKSISGVIGIGQNVEHKDYQCNLCTLKNCSHRTAFLHE